MTPDDQIAALTPEAETIRKIRVYVDDAIMWARDEWITGQKHANYKVAVDALRELKARIDKLLDAPPAATTGRKVKQGQPAPFQDAQFINPPTEAATGPTPEPWQGIATGKWYVERAHPDRYAMRQVRGPFTDTDSKEVLARWKVERPDLNPYRWEQTATPPARATETKP